MRNAKLFRNRFPTRLTLMLNFVANKIIQMRARVQFGMLMRLHLHKSSTSKNIEQIIIGSNAKRMLIRRLITSDWRKDVVNSTNIVKIVSPKNVQDKR